jgi:hypothetical protein
MLDTQDNPLEQGCKLLSDIGQCPTKFGKCPSKSNFDRTLVRSQKKFVTLYIFLLWQNPIANSLNLHFAIRHSSILLNVASEWLYKLVSWLIYILWRIYVRSNLVMLVFVRPNSSYVWPKLKVIGQMSCQVRAVRRSRTTGAPAYFAGAGVGKLRQTKLWKIISYFKELLVMERLSWMIWSYYKV